MMCVACSASSRYLLPERASAAYDLVTAEAAVVQSTDKDAVGGVQLPSAFHVTRRCKRNIDRTFFPIHLESRVVPRLEHIYIFFIGGIRRYYKANATIT